jgi:hypothetical protein
LRQEPDIWAASVDRAKESAARRMKSANDPDLAARGRASFAARLHADRPGARGDIADADGRTAAQIMRRKQDPELRAMAEQLATGGGVAAG